MDVRPPEAWRESHGCQVEECAGLAGPQSGGHGRVVVTRPPHAHRHPLHATRRNVRGGGGRGRELVVVSAHFLETVPQK